MHRAVMALQEHFRHTRRGPEVAVYLERRMRVKHIRISPPLREIPGYLIGRKKPQHIADEPEGMITIKHARPKINFPTYTPSCSFIPSLFKRTPRCLKQFRMKERRNLVTRIQAIKVGDMTVLVLRIVDILKPLLQLSMPSDLHGRQAVDHLLQRVTERFRITSDPCCLQRIAERVEHNLVVHRAARRHRPVFRRQRRCHHHPTVLGMLHQEIKEKPCRPFQNRIITFQKRPVARKEIMLPQMLCQPGSAGRPHARSGKIHHAGNAPQVRVVMRHPSPTTIHGTCRTRPGHRQVVHHFEKRLMHFAQVSHFSRPVIHFRIDIDGIFAVPRRIDASVPDALQISGLSARLR